MIYDDDIDFCLFVCLIRNQEFEMPFVCLYDDFFWIDFVEHLLSKIPYNKGPICVEKCDRAARSLHTYSKVFYKHFKENWHESFQK